MPQSICLLERLFVKNENGTGFSSPDCFSKIAQFMVSPFKRDGVPVFKRPSCKPRDLNTVLHQCKKYPQHVHRLKFGGR